MKVVIFIVILIVALGIGLYLYNSGALVKGAGDFNALFSTHGSSTSTAGTSSSFWSFLGFSGFSAPVGPSTPSSAQQSISSPSPGGINPADIPAGYTAAQLSPYFGQVGIIGMSAATFYNYGTVTLSYDNYNSTGTIDVTGWEIKSDVGNELVPQAVNLYDPTGLTPESDIIMKAGDTVYLYSNSAPFNLRLNECIGYAAHALQFCSGLAELMRGRRSIGFSKPLRPMPAIHKFHRAVSDAQYVEPAGSTGGLLVHAISREQLHVSIVLQRAFLGSELPEQSSMGVDRFQHRGAI